MEPSKVVSLASLVVKDGTKKTFEIIFWYKISLTEMALASLFINRFAISLLHMIVETPSKVLYVRSL